MVELRFNAKLSGSGTRMKTPWSLALRNSFLWDARRETAESGWASDSRSRDGSSAVRERRQQRGLEVSERVAFEVGAQSRAEAWRC